MPDLLEFGKGFILYPLPPSINRPPQHQGSLKSVFQAAFHALLAPRNRASSALTCATFSSVNSRSKFRQMLW